MNTFTNSLLIKRRDTDIRIQIMSNGIFRLFNRQSGFLKRILIVIVFNLLFSGVFAQHSGFQPGLQDRIVLTENMDRIRIVLSMSFLPDLQKEFTIQDAASSRYVHLFTPMHFPDTSLRIPAQCGWLRCTLVNPFTMPREYVIENNHFRSGKYFEFYQALPDGNFIKSMDNPLIPYSLKALPYRNTAFRFTVNPGTELTLYLRFDYRQAGILNLRIWEGKSFLQEVMKNQLLFGLITGIAFILGIYNIFLFLSLKDTSFLYFILLLLTLALFQLSNSRLLIELFSFVQLFDNWLGAIFKQTVFLSFIVFSRSLLQLKQYPPWQGKPYMLLLLLTIATGALSPFYLIFTSINSCLLIGIVVMLVAGAFRRIRSGLPEAKFYLIGVSTLICAGLVAVFQWFIPFVHIPFLLENVIELGGLGMAALFSFGLSNKIDRIRREKEEAREQAIANLRQADRLKDEFLANTSHELRTPLHGIIGLAESMLAGVSGTLPAPAVSRLTMITSSGRRLYNLVNDILDLTKIRNNELSLSKKPVDLYTITNQVVLFLNTLVRSQTLAIRNAIPPDIPLALADEDRVHQILYNLIGNAIKFTPAGSVEITAEADGEWLAVTITDTGTGIPQEYQNTIFQPFFQIDSSVTREQNGLGLGLTITKRLVELHGGTVKVESHSPGGTLMRFTLPLAATQKKAPGQAQVEPVHLTPAQRIIPPAGQDTQSGAHILIVDDDPVNVQVLIDQLSDQPFSLVSSFDGTSALQFIEQGKSVDLVLLDLMMPRLSGYDVCRKIREQYSLYELPVLMLTAKNRLQDLVAGFEAGTNDFLPKPFRKQELLSRVKGLLKLKDLTSVNHELKQVNQLKTRLMDIAAHDLRNPLSLIKGYAEMIAKKVAARQPLADYTERIMHSVARMVVLIEEFLENSRIEAGRLLLNCKPEHINGLLKEMVESFMEAAGKKQQSLRFIDETSGAIFLPVDKIYFQEIISNLVSNAVKYSALNKPIYVFLRITGSSNKQLLQVEVRDQGPGFTEEDKQKIFTAFQKLSARPTAGEISTGLGLAITRQLVELHGASIRLESVPARGSGFFVEWSLPVSC